jgi:glucose/arabinose dehydrogenase
MRKLITGAAALLAIGVSAGPGPGAQAAPAPLPAVGDFDFAAPRTLATNLAVPWGLAFLPDGSALVSERSAARVLRVTAEGAVTPLFTLPGVVVDFEDGLLGLAVSPDYATDNYVYAFSKSDRDDRIVRFRLDSPEVQDAQGRLFATEFGQSTWDEVNRIEPGANYGWPVVEGTSADSRFTDPVLQWRPAEASPSGAAIVGGNLFVAALRGTRLWQVPLAADGTPGAGVAQLRGTYGRLRTVAVAPDGHLWVMTSMRDGKLTPGPADDRILRFPPATS